MLRMIGMRLLLLIPTLMGLSILLFLWVRALPGGPATALLGDKATPEPGMDERGTSVWGDTFQRLRRNPAAMAGAVIVLIFLPMVAFAPLLAPYTGTAVPGARENTPGYIPGPGELAQFPLGLDRFGGDVLSKLIWGAQSSLMIGIISTAFGLVGGMVLGLLAGTFGGWVDGAVMRIVDILLSVPNLLLAVFIAAVLGLSRGAGSRSFPHRQLRTLVLRLEGR